MSDTDSFIEEVSEEVRRDQLFKTMRRYGWIAVLIVLLIVGGAAFNEYRKAQKRADAEALGDAVLSALNAETASERSAALLALNSEDPEQANAVLALLGATESVAAGNADEAISALKALSSNADVAPAYRRLASFKALLLESKDGEVADLRLGFGALSVPGSPYRLLAEEQLAMLDLREGDISAARVRVEAILNDAEVTDGLRNRATQILVAIGADPQETE